jgi:plasmid stabilization system protein ParE
VSFQLHPDARNEFREAVLFYGRAAERFVKAVETAIAAIILKPDRFREFGNSGFDLANCAHISNYPASQISASIA